MHQMLRLLLRRIPPPRRRPPHPILHRLPRQGPHHPGQRHLRRPPAGVVVQRVNGGPRHGEEPQRGVVPIRQHHHRSVLPRGQRRRGAWSAGERRR
ncbi:hypothetical protein LINGRAHAP2_LOCUS290 [Linum grandiflorum]